MADQADHNEQVRAEAHAIVASALDKLTAEQIEAAVGKWLDAHALEVFTIVRKAQAGTAKAAR